MTDKQKKFCEEYVVDWNGKRAAIAAGYSKKTATQIAYQILQKEEVKDYIDECKANVQKLVGISKIRIGRNLVNVASSNVDDVMDDWGKVKEWKDIAREVKAAISQLDVEVKEEGKVKTTNIKLKMHNPVPANQELNKMFGYNEPDRTQIENITPAEFPKIIYYRTSDVEEDEDLQQKLDTGEL